MSVAIDVEREIVPKASRVMHNCVCPSDSLVASLSSVCAAPCTQVEASWLHRELPGDPAHDEHLSQPRQSPSLPGILRQTHRSVESELRVKAREKSDETSEVSEKCTFASERYNIFL